MRRPAARQSLRLLLAAAALWAAAVPGVWPGTRTAAARTAPAEDPYAALSPSWGGHLRLRGSLARPDDRSVYQLVGTGTYLDGAGELRLKNQLFFGDWGRFETHYEAILLGGDAWKAGREIAALTGGQWPGGLFAPEVRTLSDDRRLMDLTHVIDDGTDGALYQRLDRLFLSVDRPWGNVRLGRQAVTWGSGMVFNPMDLFNPFAPTDVVRDYKVGDDMALVTLPFGENGDLQAVGVPRRNPETAALRWDESALGAKLRMPWGSTEWTMLAAWNHENIVAGAGAVGYIGAAAWRFDATWTVLPDESPSGGYFSAVANMDVSWTGWGKNFYGFVEIYYNGLGVTEYSQVPADPDLLDALARGEVFTLGRLYLTPHVGVELHPLFNVYVTAINNLRDPSGIVQPWCAWSVTQDIEVITGATIYWGGDGTEYGGFPISGTDFWAVPADAAYAWVTYYF
jgi:hypothetical protein